MSLRLRRGLGLLAIALALAAAIPAAAPAPPAWTNDLSPIAATDWNAARAAHLLERAGFGGTPEDVARLAAMTPKQAVDWLVNYERVDNRNLVTFVVRRPDGVEGGSDGIE